MMMNKLAKEYVILGKQSRTLTGLFCRTFYYPDANHHHLNQEVRNHTLITLNKNNMIIAPCVG